MGTVESNVNTHGVVSLGLMGTCLGKEDVCLKIRHLGETVKVIIHDMKFLRNSVGQVLTLV